MNNSSTPLSVALPISWLYFYFILIFCGWDYVPDYGKIGLRPDVWFGGCLIDYTGGFYYFFYYFFGYDDDGAPNPNNWAKTFCFCYGTGAFYWGFSYFFVGWCCYCFTWPGCCGWCYFPPPGCFLSPIFWLTSVFV